MEILKLNETIGFYRKKLGMTQEELACALGVTNQSVSKWESAQCCPDIGLIPRLAKIFNITIDELFGNEPKVESCALQFPFEDDDTLRVVVAQGHRILNTDDFDKTIDIRFPENCNETTRQYFSVEVFGNIECKDICGDVVCHGNIGCNDINGDVKACQTIGCEGDINGDVKECHSIACAADINGDVKVCHSIACGADINGNVNCEGKMACGGNIEGAVKCIGNIECKSIEGDVACQGDIIYK